MVKSSSVRNDWALELLFVDEEMVVLCVVGIVERLKELGMLKAEFSKVWKVGFPSCACGFWCGLDEFDEYMGEKRGRVLCGRGGASAAAQ